jgi:deoxyribodipyrimidine photolyase-related protein
VTIRLVLGDQCNTQHSWFTDVCPEVTYVFMEVLSETSYVVHHIQKVVAMFTAMRRMANELQKAGHTVRYLRLDDVRNQQSFTGNLTILATELNATCIEYQEPDEYRVDIQLAGPTIAGTRVAMVSSEHFMCERNAVAHHFQGKKLYVMESFYRMMRVQHNILMDNGKPVGGSWNFDGSNRSPWKGAPPPPKAMEFNTDVTEIVAMLNAMKVQTLGCCENNTCTWPTNRQEALLVLTHFVEHSLKCFGTYQDAMAGGEPWLFHSRLSFALNIKLLSPKEVINIITNWFEQNNTQLALPSVEGFIRQILGWREYMRGMYWALMPSYQTLNALSANNPLPSWYWSAQTRMNCVRSCVEQSLKHGYAHHIQRLMITGNIAALLGVHPDDVDRWYLGIYVDAFEWVEITNTRGMSQFADGGMVATKPYVSTANYINKMSNYCGSCSYNSKTRTDENSCPFNSLYWHYHLRNRHILENNHRIGMVYRTLDTMSAEERNAIVERGDYLIANADRL